MPLELKQFNSGQPGPSILILGGVHGNETCGVDAIGKWIKWFESGQAVIQSGEVTFVACCNPPAYEQSVRGVNHNLNRIIGHYDPNKRDHYEYEIADQLATLIEEHDILLDLHSTSTPTDPFGFQDKSSQAWHAFANQLSYTHADGINMTKIIVEWDKYFDDETQSFSSTLGWARKVGKIGCTVECGQHDDPNSPVVARRVVYRALSLLGITLDETGVEELRAVEPKRYRLINHFEEKMAGAYTKKYQGFDAVKQGDLIATYDNGEEIRAGQDAVILMPSQNDISGDVWFYLVEAVD